MSKITVSLRRSDSMTMLGSHIHKLLNSIIVIAYCSACNARSICCSRIHVYLWTLCLSSLVPLPFLFANFYCFNFIVFSLILMFVIENLLAWLSLECKDCDFLFCFIERERMSGKDRWTDNKNGRMQKISYQPFGQIAWFDSTKNRKDELFLLCSELLPIVISRCTCRLRSNSVHCNKIFSRHWKFHRGKSKQVHRSACDRV